ncbi:MAG: hypothetical protein ACRD2W_05355 [Acidimicrobiales bacterium]
MPVTVARGVRAKIHQDPGGILIQVQGASDTDVAAAALEAARVEIAGLDGGWESAPNLEPGQSNGPKYLAPIVPLPSGPILYVDGGETPEELLATIPDIVARHLEGAGVKRARIVSPRADGPIVDMRSALKGVLLRLYTPPDHPYDPYNWPAIPPEWFDVAAEWLAAGPHEGTVWASTVVEFPVGLGEVQRMFDLGRRAGSTTFLAGDPDRRARGAHAVFWGAPEGLDLGSGGAEATEDDLLADMEALVGIARRLAPTVAYAFVSLDIGFMRGGSYPAGGAQQGQVRRMCDEIVLDAYPYQILGPGHLERLATRWDGVSPDVTPIAEDRFELTIGPPGDWLIDHYPPGALYGDPPRLSSVGRWGRHIDSYRRNSTIQAQGRDLLGSCILTFDEARALFVQRERRPA